MCKQISVLAWVGLSLSPACLSAVSSFAASGFASSFPGTMRPCTRSRDTPCLIFLLAYRTPSECRRHNAHPRSHSARTRYTFTAPLILQIPTSISSAASCIPDRTFFAASMAHILGAFFGGIAPVQPAQQ